MSKKPILMCAQPIDKFFVWQINLYVESCIEHGFEEERIHILLYKPTNRDYNFEDWDKLKVIYPKLNIFLYEDKGVQQYLSLYIPVLRPHILWQHFLAFPELEKETIIYTDCDILWTGKPDLEKFYDNDTTYVSDASSYMNYSYFESKKNNVLQEKKEEYIDYDILEKACSIVGIDKKIIIDNNNNTGGVQYILKGITAEFWKKVEKDVLDLRKFFLEINKEFFKDENTGLQGWCSDLWGVLWNLWYYNKEVKVVPEMTFSWATDGISRIKETTIFHNAGIASNFQNGVPCFYKGKYHQGNNPLNDPHLDVVLNDERSKQMCTWFYANKLKQLYNKYKIEY